METESKTLTVRRSATWAIILAKLSAIVLLIILANMGVSWLIDRLEVQIWPQHLEIVDRAVLIAVILYIGLMATPFLPGIEVGLALMMMLGPLNLTRAETLLEGFCTTPPEKRLEFLAEKATTQTIPALLKRRYLLLALLLNLPGNALIGGGGGIGMMAGISRLYSFPKYVFLISVAILPGPMLVMLSKFFP